MTERLTWTDDEGTTWGEPVTAGVVLIAAERQRQIEQEGWAPEHDVAHNGDELALAAASYALPAYSRQRYAENGAVPYHWPWAAKDWKPTPDDRVRELVKAGALIAAEIDRLRAVDSE